MYRLHTIAQLNCCYNYNIKYQSTKSLQSEQAISNILYFYLQAHLIRTIEFSFSLCKYLTKTADLVKNHKSTQCNIYYYNMYTASL